MKSGLLAPASTPTRRPTSDTRAGFWSGSLGYPHAFVATFGAVAVGVALQALRGSMPASVLSLVVLGFMPLLAAIWVRCARHDALAKWLAGIPLAVASTAVLLAIALFGGVMPASWFQQHLGIDSPWATWPFGMAAMVMAVNLAASIAKRLTPFTFANVTFLLSHAGLLMLLAGGAYSAIAIDRVRLVLFLGQPNAVAVRADGSEETLPFEATLRSFTLESYRPTLAYVRMKEGQDDLEGVPGTEFAQNGMTEKLAGTTVVVLESLPHAGFVGDGWKPVDWPTAPPAARIEVRRGDEKVAEGWVSCGGVESPPQALEFGDQEGIVMPTPRPKRFHSSVEIRSEGRTQTEPIEVNRPATVQGWRLYQLSYDEKAGAASEYSVLEAVHDSGVP